MVFVEIMIEFGENDVILDICSFEEIDEVLLELDNVEVKELLFYKFLS